MARRVRKPEPVVRPESPYTLEESLSLTLERIRTPGKWLQGKACDGRKRCLSSAIMEVDPYGYGRTASAIRLEIDGMWLTTYNDTHTHKQVLAIIDKTIKNIPEETEED